LCFFLSFRFPFFLTYTSHRSYKHWPHSSSPLPRIPRCPLVFVTITVVITVDTSRYKYLRHRHSPPSITLPIQPSALLWHGSRLPLRSSIHYCMCTTINGLCENFLWIYLFPDHRLSSSIFDRRFSRCLVLVDCSVDC